METTSDATAPQARGPFSYENWRLADAGEPLRVTFEYPLFTDAHIVGDVIDGYGPYQLINTVPDEHRRQSRPTIVLRAQYYFKDEETSMDKTDVQRYHGGFLPDEIAALVALCLGIRLKAGGETRLFDPDEDPRGRPIAWGFSSDPALPRLSRRPVIPSLFETHSLEDTAVVGQLPVLTPKDAMALVRAARLYQEGLWIVEATPELTWLMLTSAIETAANAWRLASETAVERLRASRPKLETLLRSKGDDEFVRDVAEEIAPYMGATNKFINFILNFKVPEPKVRPMEYLRFDWTSKNLKAALKVIYDHRSQALHSGIPFPASMCQPPVHRDENGIPSEIPTMYAMSTRGGVWLTEDAPISLHIFEYIVRHTLLAWWKSLVPGVLKEPTAIMQT